MNNGVVDGFIEELEKLVKKYEGKDASKTAGQFAAQAGAALHPLLAGVGAEKGKGWKTLAGSGAGFYGGRRLGGLIGSLAGPKGRAIGSLLGQVGGSVLGARYTHGKDKFKNLKNLPKEYYKK
jgi:hypothetical protein